MRTNSKFNAGVWRRGLLTAAVLAGLCGLVRPVHAAAIDTGNPDLKLHWDNTVRYTLDDRVKDQSYYIMSQPNINDGDSNFKKGIVSNRLDLLSEADLIYKDYYGVRVSGAAWHDFAYDGGFDTASTFSYNHINAAGQQTLGLANFANRYAHGTSGELLDAFVFGRVWLGSMPLDLKLGRHTEVWGESLFPAGTYDSIAYSQQPLDLGKAASMPGVEAKELYRPLSQLSANLQVTPTLSLMGQYYFQRQPYLFPEGGTYLGNGDFYMNSVQTSLLLPEVNPANGAVLGYLPIPHGPDATPKNSGDYGLGARWMPDWFGGTLGFYYRRFSDKLPQLYLTFGATNAYHFAYADDIKLYGVSLAKNIGGISVGSEFSYRTNMPLNSDPVVVIPNAGVNMSVPGAVLITGSNIPSGQTPGARGDTWHAVLNGIDVLPGNALWDELTVVAELNADGWTKVTQGMQWFQGRPGRTGIDNVSRNSFGSTVLFDPTWYHLIPGVTLSVPISLTYGLKGNSPIFLGSAKGGGNFGYGVSADILQKYTLALQYVGFFGRQSFTNGVLTYAGTNTTLKDRGFVALTFKTTF